MQLRVEHLVLDLANVQHARKQFAHLHCGGPDEHGPAGLPQSDHIVDDGIVLFSFGLVHQVLSILPRNRTIRRNHHHVEFVDVPQFTGLCFRGSRHAREFVVHAEVVL